MSTYINSEMKPIGKFLNDISSVKVPTFQRNYAWTEDEVRQLWTDLTEATARKQEEYFLGPMVLKQGSNFVEIIDGQQRIATIYIILSVIRRIFRQSGDDKRADWLKKEYFGKEDIVTLEIQSKFHMNETNDPVFQKFIVADSSEKKIRDEMKNLLKKDSNYLLFQAITLIWELVHEYQKQFTKEDFDLGILLGIQQYIQNNVYVLFLTVTDEADAYVIFETLNDRGRELTTMDLLKNHVFGKSEGYIEQVKSQWGTFRETLADIDPRERFLHHYWTSRNGRTSKSQLFRLMRSEVTNATTALSFVTDLVNGAKAYAAFSIPGHPYWDEYDQRTRENLATLNLLDAQQALPILLAASQEFDIDEFGKLTDVLVVMAVRYNLIGEERTGVLANYYVDIPKKIHKKEITKSAKVFREIKPIYPSDEKFKTAFSTKILRDSNKARYLLTKIEEYINNISLGNDTRKINLEHILPKNPSQEWVATIKSIDTEEVDDYIYRLGNLALVSTNINKSVGSKGFDIKKEMLFSKETNIKTTYAINDYSTWLKSDIETRQVKLADIAVKVWKVEID